MEFLEICIMLYIAYLLYKKPQKEALAYKLMFIVWGMILFFYAQGGSHILPYINL